MANELTLGTRRVGDLIDFNPDTPKVKVVLEHSDRGISITIPWSNDEDPYASWFLRNNGVIHIPPRPDGPPIPRKVLFQDSYGSVLLIGCYVRGYHRNMLGPGSGKLWARAAVMGVSRNVDFDNPEGLQTTISGLRDWLGTSSWEESHNCNTEGSFEIAIRSVDVPDIEIGDFQGVRVAFRSQYAIRHEKDSGRRILSNNAYCVTRSSEPQPWSTHLKVHHAVRDLLVLSRWYEESCHETSVLHIDDPRRTPGENDLKMQWRTVVVPNTEAQGAPAIYRPYLVEYDELGSRGLLRWMTLRDEFARALDPVISSIWLRKTTANTLLAHTGPGLEALGYLLMLRDGTTEKEANKAPLKARLNRILKDLDHCLPFDSQSWVESTCSAYNGLKHANRREPEPIDVLNAWRECILVVRAWVAAELGVALEDIKERLSHDPQRLPYISIE